MKHAKLISAALLALALGAATPILTGCKTSESATGGSQSAKYTCPMHPEVVQDGPGACPKCGMALIAKK